MNKLIHESSPYLLQHAQNPVNWYPWGPEALEKAKTEDKLILVSIGYAACHWCHVMEHESFEDETVAAIMNEHFVCIKVDREERPDIDQIYMDAVVLITGQGGWPLNCFALPDGRPVSGGTYFPKNNWTAVLNQLATVYREDRSRVIEAAENITHHIQNMGQLVKTEASPFTQAEIRQMSDAWTRSIDLQFGGRQSQRNKFPLPMNNIFLLRAASLLASTLGEGDEIVQRLLQAAHVTLQRMAFGGIYDQLGGGFARYSVDPYWKVPHFEKMLYDNGQLLSLYAEAYQATQKYPKDVNGLYKRVIYQTIAFAKRELMSPEGGFYSSLDADSEGVEGKFYTWDYEEIANILGEEDAKEFAAYYNVLPEGNWIEAHTQTATNVLFVLETEKTFAEKEGKKVVAFQQKMEACREKLMEARHGRIRPGLDDKILTSWNGLMLKGLIDAYRVTREKSFLDLALKNAHFLTEKLTDGYRLFRNYKNGKRSINAFLDDYANLTDALIALYQVTFDERWLTWANGFLSHVQAHFFDADTGMYFYTSDEDDPLVSRKTETNDDVIPASNSVLAHAMHAMGLLMHSEAYRLAADQLLANIKADALKNPSWHANWALLMLKYAFPHHEVAITGPGALQARMEFEFYFLPNTLYAGAEKESGLPLLESRFMDELTIFVCQNFSCQLPVHDVEQAIGQMV